jgi:hypothetical protein
LPPHLECIPQHTRCRCLRQPTCADRPSFLAAFLSRTRLHSTTSFLLLASCFLWPSRPLYIYFSLRLRPAALHTPFQSPHPRLTTA